MIQEVSNVLKPLKFRRNVVIFVSALYIVVGLLPPYLTGLLIDRLYPDFAGASTYVFMITTIVFLLIFGFFLDWLQGFLREDLINRGAGMVRSRLFWHVLHKDYRFFLDHPVGDINNKVIHDAATYVKARLMMFPTLVLNILHLIILFGFLFRLSFQMTLVVLLFSLIFMVLYTMVNKKLRHYSVKEREDFSDLMTESNATLTGVDTIQLYAGEDYAAEYFEKLVDIYEHDLITLKYWQALSKSATNMITNMVPILMIIVGIVLVVFDQEATMGKILAFYYFLPRLKEPITAITDFNVDLQSSNAVEDRIKELLIEPVDESIELEHVDKIDELGFKNMGYNYSDGETILKDINFELKRGDTLAITGPSGAGKTTLLRLLKRQVTPTKGILAVNGKDYTHIEPASYVARIAVLPQEVFIFDATIVENIDFGKGYSEKHIRDVVRLSGVDHFSMDENALGLSGGERQRIGLARALACEYDVLILDEPTSELDHETETMVIENLKKVQVENNCMMIVVTHSANVLENLCNKELVLKKN